MPRDSNARTLEEKDAIDRKRPLVLAASSSLLAALCISAPQTEFRPPPMPFREDPFFRSRNEAHLPFFLALGLDRFQVPKGLYERLEHFTDTHPVYSLDILGAVFYNMLPHPDTGVPLNRRLMAVTPMAASEMKIHQMDLTDVVENVDGNILSTGPLVGKKWIWFDFKQRPEKGMSSVFFGCPAEAVKITRDEPLPWHYGKDSSMMIREVELLLCFGGAPIFDNFNVTNPQWRAVKQVMSKGGCRLRYFYDPFRPLDAPN